jgi:hypothetical protein
VAEPVAYWRIRQSYLSIGACVAAVGALAALIIVASVKSVDTLSTVALSLAILSFVIQIIVFMAQVGTSNEQMLRAERLYGDTVAALARLTEKAEGTQEGLARLERYFAPGEVAKAVAESVLSVPGGATSPEFVRDLSERLEERASQDVPPATDPLVAARRRYPSRVPSPDDEEIVRLLSTFPPEGEASGLIERLQTMNSADKSVLEALGDDELQARSARSGSTHGFFFRPEHVSDLVSEGLVRAKEPRVVDRGRELVELTPDGRNLARMFIATPPDDLEREVDSVRPRL